MNTVRTFTPKQLADIRQASLNAKDGQQLAITAARIHGCVVTIEPNTVIYVTDLESLPCTVDKCGTVSVPCEPNGSMINSHSTVVGVYGIQDMVDMLTEEDVQLAFSVLGV